MVTNNLESTFSIFEYFLMDNFTLFATIFGSFYILQIVCMDQFMVKSVEIM